MFVDRLALVGLTGSPLIDCQVIDAMLNGLFEDRGSNPRSCEALVAKIFFSTDAIVDLTTRKTRAYSRTEGSIHTGVHLIRNKGADVWPMQQ
jgi:hypothetical protein